MTGRNHSESERDSKHKPVTGRERSLDKTLEDSFPTSDPPSTIPDPEETEDAA